MIVQLDMVMHAQEKQGLACRTETITGFSAALPVL